MNITDTSLAARDSIEEHLNRLETIVLQRIRQAGTGGLTTDEIEAATQLSHQTASARVRDLAAKHCRIVDSGVRRPTRSGRKAIVWVAAEFVGAQP